MSEVITRSIRVSSDDWEAFRHLQFGLERQHAHGRPAHPGRRVPDRDRHHHACARQGEVHVAAPAQPAESRRWSGRTGAADEGAKRNRAPGPPPAPIRFLIPQGEALDARRHRRHQRTQGRQLWHEFGHQLQCDRPTGRAMPSSSPAFGRRGRPCPSAGSPPIWPRRWPISAGRASGCWTTTSPI